jgi:HSP20 family molecular chaperone IbpA
MLNHSLRLVVAAAAILLWAAVAAARDRASESEMNAAADDPLSSILHLQQEMDWMFDAEDGLFRAARGLAPRETVPEITASEERSPEGPILVLKAPGLDKKSLKIDVDRRGIRLSYDARTTREERDSTGRVTSRYESVESLRRFLPVPDGADSDSARVETRGDEIRIHFHGKRDLGPRA